MNPKYPEVARVGGYKAVICHQSHVRCMKRDSGWSFPRQSVVQVIKRLWIRKLYMVITLVVKDEVNTRENRLRLQQ